MNKRSSYLCERNYLTDNRLIKNDETKNTEWKKLLGDDVYDKVINSHRNFKSFLYDQKYINLEEIETKEFWEFVSRYEYEREVIKNVENRNIYFPAFYVVLIAYAKEKMFQYFDIEVLTNEFLKEFESQLLKRLQAICVRTLIAQMHMIEKKDSKEEDLYVYFSEEIVGKEVFIKSIFEKYPVLHRVMLETIDNFVNYYIEIYNNFQKDRRKIKEMYQVLEITKLNKIVLASADVHNNGKQVARVIFNDNYEIIYKPRSMGAEQAYMELLQWISKMIKVSQKKYEFLTYEDHSWSTIVEYEECISQKQLHDYYTRLGVQLLLIYVLGTKDLHYENLIASGPYPVFVDLETLTNIKFNCKRVSAKEEIIYELLQSVLYTGVLPFYAWNREGTGINSSAISGKGDQTYPFKVPVIVDGGTEKMRIEYHYLTSKNKQNIVTVGGIFHDPTNYKEDLIAGFKSAYRCILENKTIFYSLLMKMENVKSRYLVADTQRYAMLLASSYHPTLLKDGAVREVFLYSMWKGREEKAIVDCEVKELLSGDIPYFYFFMNSKSIENIRGEKITNYFEKRPIDLLYEKVKKMNVKDMEKQCEYINWVMDATSENFVENINKVYLVEEVYRGKSIAQHDKDAIIDDLTNRIINQAIWNETKTEVSWSIFQFASNGKTWDIKPMNFYLYGGLAGMLLLLYEMKDKEKRAVKLYDTVKEMLFRYTDEMSKSMILEKDKRVGMYDGESSIVYAYLILHNKGEKDFLQHAIKHAVVVERLIEYDKKYDIIAGNAGSAQIMMMLYEITREEKYLLLAERAVLMLRESAQRQEKGVGWKVEKDTSPMAGMAHGNSGILIPVLKLWKLTKKEEFEQFAEDIWSYENSLYDYQTENWKDMRTGESEVEGIGAVAWCHGAPGILLARILSYRLVNSSKWKSRIYEDIKKAYLTTKKYWTRDSWSICHGNCGNYGILLIAAKDILTNNEIMNNGFPEMSFKLLQQEKLNPGLFSGYGGILYALLKDFDIDDILYIS